MFFNRQKGIKTKILTIILMVSFFAPSALLISTPQKTEAQMVPVLDSPNLAVNTALLAETTTLVAKETILDLVAWMLVKTLIRQFTMSIVNWINSGFQGGPAFITNPGQFLADVANVAAGQFIEEVIPVLCEPFALDIDFALFLNFNFQPYEDKFECTLDDVIGNIKNFTSGDFYDGGWDGWLEITQKPTNNPYGAYVEAKKELSIKITGAQSIQLLELDWGGGFLSFKDAEGNITTPGKLIADQIAFVTGSEWRTAELADELNEAISAIGFALVNQVFGGVMGAIGGSSSGGGLSNFNSDNLPDFFPENPVEIEITATPENVSPNSSSIISWNSNAEYCIKSGGVGNWQTPQGSVSPANSGSAPFITPPLVTSTTFTINCYIAEQSNTASVTVTVGTPESPVITSFFSTPSSPPPIPHNTNPTLSWSAIFADECVLTEPSGQNTSWTLQNGTPNPQGDSGSLSVGNLSGGQPGGDGNTYSFFIDCYNQSVEEPVSGALHIEVNPPPIGF